MTTIQATIPERVALPANEAPASTGSSSGLTIGDILTIIRQRLVMVIILWLFFSSLAVGGWYVWWKYFPSWSATAYVECITDRPSQSLQLVAERPAKDEYERFVKTQSMMVKSPPVLEKVLKAPEVQATAWYNQERSRDRMLDLMDALGSSHLRGTNYIQISMSTRDRNDPHKIVNEVIQTYHNSIKEKSQTEYREELEAYKKEQTNVDNQITQKRNELDSLAAELPPGTSLEGVGGIQYEELRLYAEQVAALELQTRELEALKDIYTSPSGAGLSSEDVQIVEMDPKIQFLSNQMFTLLQELEVQRREFGPNHRQVKAIVARMETSNRQLEQERDAKLQQQLNFKKEQVRTAFLNSQEALLLAREKLSEAKAAQADADRKITSLQMTLRDLEYLQESKENIATYINEVERVVSARTAVKVDVVQRAIPPLERSSPTMMHIPIGIVLALFLSMGLAVGLDLLDTSVRTPRDLIRYLNVPVLGTVTDADDEEVEIEKVETAVRDAPRSMFVENFRNIRVNLQLSAPAERQRSILVTSAKPEDGKTMCVSNLALAIAQTGRRVLIIDANFRRPAVHNIYHLDQTPGLSNMLIGEGNLEGMVRRTDVPNLDVLASGPLPPNPVELLGSPEMRKVLEDATRMYDQIIIDAPPVLLATDGLVLSTMVDGVVLVVRAKENSRGIANRAVNLLQRVNAHLFGCILNRAQAQRGGYFREQLRTYYDYHELDQLESETSRRKKLPKKDDDEDENDDVVTKADASDDSSDDESKKKGFHHKPEEDDD